MTVEQVKKEIVESNQLDMSPNCLLFLPGSPTTKPRWPSTSATLSSLNLNTNDTVYLRSEYVLLKTFFVYGKTASDIILRDVLYLIPERVGVWLAFLGIKFKIEDIDDYEIFLRGRNTPLDRSKTFAELGMPLSAQVVIRKPKMQFNPDLLGVVENTSSQKITSPPKKKGGVDWQSAAGALTNPDMKGQLNMRLMQGKKPKGKWDRKYVVVKGNIMFCYKAPTDTRPLCIYPLEGSTCTVLEDNPKKKLFVFEVALAEGDQQLLCRVPTSEALKSWTNAVNKDETSTRPMSQRESEGGKLFGAPLSSAVSLQDGSELPALIEDCISYIEARALEAVGIFRLSGSAVQIEKYKEQYDKGERVDLSQEQDPHAVAGLMKLYFRELPEPILSFELYHNFIIAADAPKIGCEKELVLHYVRFLLKQLPALNYAVLKRLICFLRKVSEHSDVNKMALHNLATVFGPNLLSKKNSNMFEMVEDTPQINSIVNTLIQDYEKIFNNAPITDIKSIGGTVAKALYDYEPQRDEEITLKKGDLVHIINKGSSGWWIGECNEKFGKFPGTYVEVMSNEARDGALRKQRFMEDYGRVKDDFERETKKVEELESRKKELEEALEEIEHKQASLDTAAKELRQLLAKEFEGGRLSTFTFEVEDLCDKLAKNQSSQEAIDYMKGQLMQGLENLSKTLTAPDPKKKKDKKNEKNKEVVLNAINQIWNKFIGDDLARKNLTDVRAKIYEDVLELRALLKVLVDV